MRADILAALGLMCLCATPGATPAAAVPLADGATVVKTDHRVYDRDDYGRGRGRWGYGPDCRELRRACLNKEELGEVGRGNCQRYRSLCR